MQGRSVLRLDNDDTVSPAAPLRIERVAQAVANKVEGEHSDHDHHTGRAAETADGHGNSSGLHGLDDGHHIAVATAN
jgi:hypothetical protein